MTLEGVRMRALQQDIAPEGLKPCPVTDTLEVLMDAVDAEIYQDAEGAHWMVSEDGLVLFIPQTDG